MSLKVVGVLVHTCYLNVNETTSVRIFDVHFLFLAKFNRFETLEGFEQQ